MPDRVWAADAIIATIRANRSVGNQGAGEKRNTQPGTGNKENKGTQNREKRNFQTSQIALKF